MMSNMPDLSEKHLSSYPEGAAVGSASSTGAAMESFQQVAPTPGSASSSAVAASPTMRKPPTPQQPAMQPMQPVQSIQPVQQPIQQMQPIQPVQPAQQKTIQIVQQESGADKSRPQRSIRMSVTTPPASPVPFQEKKSEAAPPPAPYAAPDCRENLRDTGALRNLMAQPKQLQQPLQPDDCGIETPKLLKPSQSNKGGMTVNAKPPKQLPAPVETQPAHVQPQVIQQQSQPQVVQHQPQVMQQQPQMMQPVVSPQYSPAQQPAAAQPVYHSPAQQQAQPQVATPGFKKVLPPQHVAQQAPQRQLSQQQAAPTPAAAAPAPAPAAAPAPAQPQPMADPSMLLSGPLDAKQQLPIQQFNTPINLYSNEAAQEEFKKQANQAKAAKAAPPPVYEEPAREEKKKKNTYADPNEIKHYQAKMAAKKSR